LGSSLSLSIENLLENSSRKLIESIVNIKENSILKNELDNLEKDISITFIKAKYRYITYYNIASILYDKGYLVHSLSLIFESIGFYIKSKFKNFSEDLYIFIENEENKIKSTKDLDYYRLIDACRSFFIFDNNKNINTLFQKNHKKIIYNKIDNINNIKQFKKFIAKVKKLRNNLLHANSGNILNNPQNDIKNILEEFGIYCLKKDILKIS
jgi:hypothetical protein